MRLNAYGDSDYKGCLDTRKYIKGYQILFGTSLISWKSKKQQTSSKSSVEAEYKVMTNMLWADLDGVSLKYLWDWPFWSGCAVFW